MGNKTYYFLKIPEEYFRGPEIKKLRKIAGGDIYVIIYLKMMLLSLEQGGTLYYQGVEKSFADEIALILDEEPDNVQITINYLLSTGLLIDQNSSELFLTEVPELIAKDTYDARRMRKKRNAERIAKKEEQKGLIVNKQYKLQESSRTENEHCSNNVQKCSSDVQVRSKKFTESDIELDIDIESVSQKDRLYSNSIYSENERQTDDWEEITSFGSRKNIPLTQTEYQGLLDDYGEKLSELLELVSIKLDARKTGSPIASYTGYIRQVALDKGFKTIHIEQQEERAAKQKKIDIFLKKLNTFAETGAIPNEDDFEKAKELGVDQEELIKIKEKAKKVIEQRKNE